MRKQTNTLSPSPKCFQSPKFSDSDFREVQKSADSDSDVRKALLHCISHFFGCILTRKFVKAAISKKIICKYVKKTNFSMNTERFTYFYESTCPEHYKYVRSMGVRDSAQNL
jgi:hypothetical protein